MNARTIVLMIAITGFGFVTGLALDEVGYLGILDAGLTNWGTTQIFVDLIIVCSLAIIWMIADARHSGVNPWPFVGITLFAGSFGPLLYLLRREWKPRPTAAQHSPTRSPPAKAATPIRQTQAPSPSCPRTRARNGPLVISP